MTRVSRVQREWRGRLPPAPPPDVARDDLDLFLLHVSGGVPYRALAPFCGRSETYVMERCQRVALATEAAECAAGAEAARPESRPCPEGIQRAEARRRRGLRHARRR